MDHLDTLIIGAGVAGLTAAAELLARGRARIRILEASDRYGGRVLTQHPVEGDIFELGATWLHGSTRNPLYDFTAQQGILAGARRYMTDDVCEAESSAQPWPCKDRDANAASSERDIIEYDNAEFDHCGHEGEVVLRPGGHVVRPGTVSSITGSVTKSLRRAGKLACAPDIDPSASVLQRITAEFSGDSSSAQLPPSLVRSLFEVRHCDECLYTGANSAADLSLTGFGCYDMMDGQNTPPPRGFMSVVDVLAQPAVAAGVIEYGKTVIGIDGSGKGGQQQQRQMITVRCADGSAYTARAVLVTVSLGVLKHWTSPAVALSSRPVFNPPLPTSKVASIHRQGFGRVEKVHLEYDTFWWRGLWAGVQPRAAGVSGNGANFTSAAEEELARKRSEGCFGLVFAWDQALVRPGVPLAQLQRQYDDPC